MMTQEFFPQDRRKEFLVLLLFCCVMTAFEAARGTLLAPGDPEYSQPIDHHKYLYMATQNPFGFHMADAGRRVAVPFIAGLLPLPILRSFFLLAYLSISLTGVVVYYLAKAAGFSRDWAFCGTLLYYGCGVASKYILTRLYLTPEPETFFLVGLLLLLIYKKWDLAFGLVLLLGVTVKETVAYAGPLFYTLQARRWWDSRMAGRAVLVGAPALAALLAIRILIPAWNDDPNYTSTLPDELRIVHAGDTHSDLWHNFELVMEERRTTRALDQIRMLSFGAVGILFVLPFLDLRRNASLLLRALPLFALSYLTTLFAFGDQRRVAFAYALFILMSLNGMTVLARWMGAEAKHFLPLFLLLALLLLVQRNSWMTPYDLQSFLFLAYCGGLYYWLQQRPSPGVPT